MQNVEVVENIEVSKYEKALIQGDLSKLTLQECEQYYINTCKSVGLNPLTKPFEYLLFQGRKMLYLTKAGAEQIRQLNGVSVVDIKREKDLDLGIIEIMVKVKDKNGREDVATAVLNIANLKGDNLCNALMKCETKAKRRATLSLCGLGHFENEPDELKKVEELENENNENKIKELINLADKKGTDLIKLCQFYGKNDVSELTNDNLKHATAVLEKKADIAEAV